VLLPRAANAWNTSFLSSTSHVCRHPVHCRRDVDFLARTVKRCLALVEAICVFDCAQPFDFNRHIAVASIDRASNLNASHPQRTRSSCTSTQFMRPLRVEIICETCNKTLSEPSQRAAQSVNSVSTDTANDASFAQNYLN